ncbi:unnamed protein product [Blepharisma stoltei]|uniref:3-hydroxyisobutyryl-CoA hydrolase n=1 Tax=Blepharisma stoltei TaxID=1481888 RepID=A0AAU9JCN8_9CILI|nr:unnamed protein product [Blepharisma stoltei]
MVKAKLNSLVRSTEHNDLLHIHINRPKALNALNKKIIREIASLVREAHNQSKNVLFTGEGRAFSAGGDVVSIIKADITPEEFYQEEFTLIYFVSRMLTERVAIMDGIVMGGGVGLSMACSIRVATNNTAFAMPEGAIGYIPDVGASYFLSRMNPPELGLYLSLTGERLSGVDCYLFGLAQYYIECDTDLIISGLYEGSIENVLQVYHVNPSWEKSSIIPYLDQIKQCFIIDGTVELVVKKLSQLDTPWTVKTLQKIQTMCPLSLKISYEAFRRGKSMTYKDCLAMEYNLVVQMQSQRSINFLEGVRHKLVVKASGTPNWVPDDLIELGDGSILPYFANKEGPRLELPRL